ncbi:MAG: tripartite tricarboxylate transporter substrate binding protein [Alphaproteobacteria bacterium]|nr:tripartite tricarboxylate transporter substrate binding protein [Alphaproteobacteria bacterium]
MVRIALLAGIALAWMAGAAVAQSYPSRPIRMIVPFSPGGPSDITARLFGQKLTEAWGQPVVIDNRAGASGMIGTEMAVKAPPDGYTLVLTNSADAISVGLYPKMPYDILKDLQPVSLLIYSPFILVVHPSLEARTLGELMALAKAKPGQIGFASGGGVGVPSHMAGELLKWRAKIDLIHIPYKGQGPATADVLAGHVPMMFTNAVNGLPHIREGKLRALGLSTPQRIPVAPEIVPLAEQGLPGFEVGIWFGVQAPAGTPASIVRKLMIELHRILATPEMQASLNQQGAIPLPEGPEQFTARLRGDIATWTEVIRAADIKPE